MNPKMKLSALTLLLASTMLWPAIAKRGLFSNGTILVVFKLIA